MNLIDVKDFNLHSDIPQFRNGIFTEKMRKVGGSTNGSLCELVTVEATIFHPTEARVHKYLDDRIKNFKCSYIAFGFTNPSIVGENKTAFETNSLGKLQEAYTIIEYDKKDGVKIQYNDDMFVSVSYPEEGVRIKIEPEYKYWFYEKVKEIDVFQFVDWLMSE